MPLPPHSGNLDDFYALKWPGRPIEWVSCLNRADCLSQEQCRPGSAGVLCATCIPGYIRTPGGCEECPATNTIIGAALPGIVMVCGVIFITAALSAKRAGHSKALLSSMAKLMINYMVSMASLIPVARALVAEKRLDALLWSLTLSNSTDTLNQEDSRFGMVDEILQWGQTLSGSVPGFHPLCLLQPSFDVSGWDITYEDVDNFFDANMSSHLLPEYDNVRAAIKSYHWHWQVRKLLFWAVSPIAITLLVILFSFVLILFLRWKNKKLCREAADVFEQIAIKGYTQARIDTKHNDIQMYKYLNMYSHRFCGLWSVRKIAMGRYTWSMVWTEISIGLRPLCVVTTFFLYPYVVRGILEPVDCLYAKIEERTDDTRTDFRTKNLWMVASPDLTCMEVSDPLFWASILLSLLAIFGVPLTIRILLERNKEEWWKPSVQRTWAFMTDGYEIDRRNWECHIALRKATCIAVTKLLVLPRLKLTGLLFVSFFCAVLHIIYKPFENRNDELLDNIESRHLVLLNLFIMIGIVAADPVCSVWTLIALTSVTVMCHFGFVAWLGSVTLTICRNSVAEHMVQHMELMQHSTSVDKMFSSTKKHKKHGFHVHFLAECLTTKSVGRMLVSSYKRFLDKELRIKVQFRRDYTFKVQWIQLFRGEEEPPISEWLVPISGDERLTEGSLDVPEKHLRAFLAVVAEAFEYVIVNCRFALFSTTLFEFIIRVGFAFDFEGNHRKESIKETTWESMASSQSETHKEIGHAHASITEENKGMHKQIQTVVRQIEAEAASKKHDTVVPDGTPPAIEKHSFEISIDEQAASTSGHLNITVLRAAVEQAREAGLPLAELEAGERALDCALASQEESEQRSCLQEEFRIARLNALHPAMHGGDPDSLQRAIVETREAGVDSRECNDAEQHRTKLAPSFPISNQTSTMSSVSKIGSLDLYNSEDPHSASLRHSSVRTNKFDTDVHWMLSDQIFRGSVFLSDFQDNLGKLTTLPEHEVEHWFNAFEQEWHRQHGAKIQSETLKSLFEGVTEEQEAALYRQPPDIVEEDLRGRKIEFETDIKKNEEEPHLLVSVNPVDSIAQEGKPLQTTSDVASSAQAAWEDIVSAAIAREQRHALKELYSLHAQRLLATGQQLWDQACFVKQDEAVSLKVDRLMLKGQELAAELTRTQRALQSKDVHLQALLEKELTKGSVTLSDFTEELAYDTLWVASELARTQRELQSKDGHLQAVTTELAAIKVGSSRVGQKFQNQPVTQYHSPWNHRTAGTGESPDSVGIRDGSAVRLHGLVNSTHLNDCIGTCVTLVECSSGQWGWTVKLSDGRLVSIKPENLQRVDQVKEDDFLSRPVEDAASWSTFNESEVVGDSRVLREGTSVRLEEAAQLFGLFAERSTLSDGRCGGGGVCVPLPPSVKRVCSDS